MHRMLALVVGALLAASGAASASADGAAVGAPAPAFAAQDAEGRPRSLQDYHGKFVVLEWFNNDCPFVRKHYGSGNMQRLQATYTAQGVAWLTISSSAPGKQGHLTAEQAKAIIGERGATPTALLLDPDGAIGRRYGAKTTPHMFVIDPAGTVIYAGAIDDTPSADPADIARATNLVAQALDAAQAGKPVPVAESKPYGCSVKYAE